MKLCDFTIVINSHNYMYTRWFYSRSEASVRGNEIFTIKKVTLPPGIMYLFATRYSESLCEP